MSFAQKRIRELAERHFVWFAIGLGVAFYLVFEAWTGGFIPEDAAVQQINYLTLSGYKVPFEDRPVMWYADAGVHEAIERIRERRRAGKRTVLILGPSHLHSIVEGRPGDRYAIWYANKAAAERGAGTRYIQISEPNFSLAEMLAVVVRLRDADALPDVLMVGYSYVNLQVKEARHTVRKRCEDAVRRARDRVSDDASLAHLCALFDKARRSREAAIRRKPTLGTPQEWLENRLIRFCERVWPAYRKRSIVNAYIIYRTVTGTRNAQAWVSQRLNRVTEGGESVPPPQWRLGPIDPEVAEYNLRALDSLTSLAREAGLSVNVYRVPFPRDYPGSLADEAGYDASFLQVSNRLARLGARVLDFERMLETDCFHNPVERRPGHPPLDYFHFQDTGHRLLGPAWDRVLLDAGEAP